MAILNPIKQRTANVLDNVTEGWSRLWDRARTAVTRFTPKKREDDLQAQGSEWLPATPGWSVLGAEIKETGKEIVVRLEAPGMEADDVDIQVIDDSLLIRSEKHWQRSDTKGRYHLLECAYGEFERVIPLPRPVDDGHAKAKYRRGVLTVTLPITKAYQARRIDIAR
ncbi:heat shock protein, putative [hydrothermal vent metagenome]|uniref:Heat shock protein, putative n=1 Tax=hydrothermal vent metagenome TaxID=652676 RepID=A0A3B1AV01_9ZZZZ